MGFGVSMQSSVSSQYARMSEDGLVCMSACLSISESFCLFVCLTVYLFVCLRGRPHVFCLSHSVSAFLCVIACLFGGRCESCSICFKALADFPSVMRGST